MAGNAFDEQSDFLRSEKDTRPYWETQHRALALPLIKSGYNDSVRYGVPGLLGGASWGVLDDILRGRDVAKGEVEAAAGDAAGAAMTGAFAAPRPKGSIGMAGREEAAPVRAYHGTTSDIKGRFDRIEGGNARGDAVYFTTSPESASRYATGDVNRISPKGDAGPNVIPVDITGKLYDETATIPASLRKRMAEMANDGVNARNAERGRATYPDELQDPNQFAGSYFDRAYPPNGYNVLDSLVGSDPNKANEMLRALGYDGRTSGNRSGSAGGGGADIAMWNRGTVRSATTGDLLFANPKQASAANSAEHIAKASARDEIPGFRAYHGSPHDFDKFDLSKIGTGEGAQAYGHGLYFAENEGVAGSYRTALSRAHGGWKFDGKPLEKPEDFWTLQKQLEDVEGNWRLNKLVNEFYSLRRQGYSKDEAIKNRQDWHRSDPEMQAAIDEFAKRSDMTEVPGRLYEVNIKADPEHFLDWDKPLSQQSEKVRKALDAAGYKLKPLTHDDAAIAALEARQAEALKKYDDMRKDYFSDWKDISKSEAKFNKLPSVWRAQQDIHNAADAINRARNERDAQTGKGILQGLSDSPLFGATYDKATANVSQKLREAGIPGIRYLDQGSRTAGDGSRNYVVFDDSLVKIIRKYGMAGLAAFLAASSGADQSNAFDGRRQ